MARGVNRLCQIKLREIELVALHIVLYQPEIPPNTGNIIRLCANTGADLHIVGPMGFVLDDKRLRRAGLDYHEYANVQSWSSLMAYCQANPDRRLVAVETPGDTYHSEFSYQPSDALLFGSETRGLPTEVLMHIPRDQIVKVPMLRDSRSLNLSNCVAIVVYEAWRQLGYDGAA